MIVYVPELRSKYNHDTIKTGPNFSSKEGALAWANMTWEKVDFRNEMYVYVREFNTVKGYIGSLLEVPEPW